MVILSNLTTKTLHDRDYRQYKEKKLEKEFQYLEKISGREIAVEPYDYFRMTDYKNMQFGFLIESYEPLGNLYSWLQQPLTQAHKEDLIGSLIEKVHAMHELGILHLDIKDENIVIHFNPETEKHEVRLIDWESALPIDADPTEKASYTGTPLYRSPECCTLFSAMRLLPPEKSVERQHMIQEFVSYVAPSSDVWSLGIVLDRIYNERSAVENIVIRAQEEARKKFAFYEIEAAIAKIDQQQIDIHFVDKIGPINLLIYRMLCIDPQKRLTMGQVKSKWKGIRGL